MVTRAGDSPNHTIVPAAHRGEAQNESSTGTDGIRTSGVQPQNSFERGASGRGTVATSDRDGPVLGSAFRTMDASVNVVRGSIARRQRDALREGFRSSEGPNVRNDGVNVSTRVAQGTERQVVQGVDGIPDMIADPHANFAEGIAQMIGDDAQRAALPEWLALRQGDQAYFVPGNVESIVTLADTLIEHNYRDAGFSESGERTPGGNDWRLARIAQAFEGHASHPEHGDAMALVGATLRAELDARHEAYGRQIEGWVNGTVGELLAAGTPIGDVIALTEFAGAAARGDADALGPAALRVLTRRFGGRAVQEAVVERASRELRAQLNEFEELSGLRVASSRAYGNPLDESIGPLSASYAQTFRSSRYHEVTFAEDVILSRRFGGPDVGRDGGYWALRTTRGTDNTLDDLSTRIDMALDASFGNHADEVAELIIPAGQPVYLGRAAPSTHANRHLPPTQSPTRDAHNLSDLPGGGLQVFVPRETRDLLARTRDGTVLRSVPNPVAVGGATSAAEFGWEIVGEPIVVTASTDP